MNDFKRLNQIVREQKALMNALYKDLENETIIKGVKICEQICKREFASTSFRVAMAHRLVALKPDPLENELKKLNVSEADRKVVREAIFLYVREIYENSHKNLIAKVQNERITDDFNMALIIGMHGVGLTLNEWQILWQAHIIDGINREFETKFKTLLEASEFIAKNGLFQPDENGEKADRSYGAVIKNGEKYAFAPYALAFKKEVEKVAAALEELILNLQNFASSQEHLTYINYFKALKDAFCEQDNARVIPAWQRAEILWMDVKGALQPGHPLEYYEDSYTHAVALEWDIRLSDDSGVNEEEFKAKILDSYSEICERISAQTLSSMHEQVRANVARTQLYVSVPMIYYAAELNGLFSAQVVPNDESVSARCGKKIFAFVNHVYESAKSKPFSRLSAEIFELNFLNVGREILFRKPEIWKKIYEISTIGHEFGHILFIDKDSENLMNKSGVFKFIEEYKATTGGLVNFFLHEDERYANGVFCELISRAVGLIGWRLVDEVRAYYCEGLIHLSLLFGAGVLKFDGKSLKVDISPEAYGRFKAACLKNYEDLAAHYAAKRDAREFLEKFCINDGASYLPKEEQTKDFVEFYHSRFVAIGNELDESGEWERWQNI